MDNALFGVRGLPFDYTGQIMFALSTLSGGDKD